MAKNEKTVSLPALPEGRIYIDIAETLSIKLGCGVGMRDFKPGSHSSAIHDGTYAYGLRQCGGDGGAKGADASDAVKKAGVIERCDSIDAGTHVYGAGGGGSSLSTLVVVLRENVLKELVKIGKKKADVTKAVTASPENAFLMVSAAKADAIRADVADKDKASVTTEAAHAALWPDMEADAKAEANRRDKAAGTVVTSQSVRDKILAMATTPKDDESVAA